MGRFQLRREDVATHGPVRGLLSGRASQGNVDLGHGCRPRRRLEAHRSPVTQHIVLPDAQQRDLTMVKSLKAHLAELGYSSSGITYLALLHYHYHHPANANEFARATWLVRQGERDAMFAEKPPGTTQPSTYSALTLLSCDL